MIVGPIFGRDRRGTGRAWATEDWQFDIPSPPECCLCREPLGPGVGVAVLPLRS